MRNTVSSLKLPFSAILLRAPGELHQTPSQSWCRPPPTGGWEATMNTITDGSVSHHTHLVFHHPARHHKQLCGRVLDLNTTELITSIKYLLALEQDDTCIPRPLSSPHNTTTHTWHRMQRWFDQVRPTSTILKISLQLGDF